MTGHSAAGADGDVICCGGLKVRIWAHQCRQKTVEVKAKCGKCTLHWCPRCLLNRYGEDVEAVRAWAPGCCACPVPEQALRLRWRAGQPAAGLALPALPRRLQLQQLQEGAHMRASPRWPIAALLLSEHASTVRAQCATSITVLGRAEARTGGDRHPGGHVQGGWLHQRVAAAGHQPQRQAAGVCHCQATGGRAR